MVDHLDGVPSICRVNTDEGIYGYGEASVGFDTGASASYQMIKEVAPFVIGMDPMATEAVWDKMYTQTFWAQGGGIHVFPRSVPLIWHAGILKQRHLMFLCINFLAENAVKA